MKNLIITIVCALFLMTGCASSIRNMSGSYQDHSRAIRDFAEISAKDWLFGSGIIQGALDGHPQSKWIIDELKKVDKWFLDGEGKELENVKLDSLKLGKTVGIRFRLMGPVVKASLRQYAPGVLLVTEVITVLSFIGL